MTEWRVRWEVDLSADTPQEAARMALGYQRNPESIATSFDVFERDELAPGGIVRMGVTVDLEGDEGDDE